MSSKFGTVIATDRNSCFKLSGSLERPPYPLPAGFRVTKIPASWFTSISRDMNVIVVAFDFSAAWMVWIWLDTALRTSSSSRLNSSKHPQAPHFSSPVNIRPIDLKSNSSSQLNTNTCRPSACPRAFTLSVFPVPAGPYGLPPYPRCMPCVRVR